VTGRKQSPPSRLRLRRTLPTSASSFESSITSDGRTRAPFYQAELGSVPPILALHHLQSVIMHRPPWMCNDPNCAFRNRLLADAKLTTPHACSQPPPIPVFVNPFPTPKPNTILPPPPLAPAPPRSFYFPAPCFPPPAPPAFFPLPGPPVPMMPPAPMPPGPYMLPPPLAPPAALPAAPSPPVAEQENPPLAPPHHKKSPSIGSVVHDKGVHKVKPKKGPISKHHKEALSDFEERTRRQEYRDLAESSQQQSSHKPETGDHPPKKPRSILKHRQTITPAVNQEVHVNVYNSGHNSNPEGKNNTADSSESTKSAPAKDAASVRKAAIKRAHSLAQGIGAAAAPAATMDGALPPRSEAGSHAASKPPSDASAKSLSHASKASTTRAAPSNAPSTIKERTHKLNPTRARARSHHRQPPLALAAATATANAQVSPPSIESWRDSVRRPVPG